MAWRRNLVCDEEARRDAVSEHDTLNGIDYLEVSAESLHAQRFLHVHFLKTPPPDGLEGNPSGFRIEGGVRIRSIRVLSVTRANDHLIVEMDRVGDFSPYVLAIEHKDLDPLYSKCEFSFKAGCPSRFDCRPRPAAPYPEPPGPPIDYMAKDYASFRQALLDLIPTLAPQWQERHAADLGMALVELLAYVGDRLSYYQDAVATEAYLETARQRISVRRLTRLIDYQMHDGATARAFVHFALEENSSGRLPTGTQLLTKIKNSAVIRPEERSEALVAAEVIFETLHEAHLHSSLNECQIYPWGNRQCCLPPGTTSLDLVGDLAADLATDPPNIWKLKPGDFLLLEEVKSPLTGQGKDRDTSHRQVVRLIEVEKSEDPLPTPKLPLTRVTWDRADALKFPLWVSRKLDGRYEQSLSVARGNLVLADHGRTISEEEHPGPQPPRNQKLRRAHRIRLEEGPLSHRIPLPKEEDLPTAVARLSLTDPRTAEPQVTKLRVTDSPLIDEWIPMPHLLESRPFDAHFGVETDNQGRALLRFGDGEFGMRPPDMSTIKVTYRVGLGAEGNVGAESLGSVINPGNVSDWPAIMNVRNPLPAWGGTEPEAIEQARQWAPAAFHAEQFRAVTEGDYARVASKHPDVAKAVATFRWTGSWPTVFVAIDPVGRTDVPIELEKRVKGWIQGHALAGYDVEIDPPTFVPLHIEIEVCVAPNYFRAHVEEALSTALSNQSLPHGQRGFFHPDNFTFGQPLYLSELYAAVEQVEGVDSAVVTRFIRLHEVDPEPNRPTTQENLDRGFLPMGRLEIMQLDNDLNFPENGVLRLIMQGGK